VLTTQDNFANLEHSVMRASRSAGRRYGTERVRRAGRRNATYQPSQFRCGTEAA